MIDSILGAKVSLYNDYSKRECKYFEKFTPGSACGGTRGMVGTYIVVGITPRSQRLFEFNN